MKKDQIGDLMLEIYGKLDPSKSFAISNEPEEKAKVFANPEVNPKFQYKIEQDEGKREELQSVKKQLENVNLKDAEEFYGSYDKELGDAMVDLYERKIRALTNGVDMSLSIALDPVRFSELENLAYSSPTQTTLNHAHSTTDELIKKSLKRKIETEDLTFEEAKKIVGKELYRNKCLYGGNIDRWSVVPEIISSNASLKAFTKELRIKKDKKFSRESFPNVLTEHEMNHIFRAENGYQQPSKIFVAYFPNFPFRQGGSSDIEEAIAIRSEEGVTGENDKRSFEYCQRAIAADLSKREGFSTIYNKLRHNFTKAYGLDIEDKFVKNQAWKTTRRVKAGLRDTSKPGGRKYIHEYLTGRLALQEFEREGGDLKKLYVGRIGINDLPLVNKLTEFGLLEEPRYLPEYLRKS